MTVSEGEGRPAIVRQARRWVGTRYHHRARVMGAGVDCAQILIATFAAAGLIEDFDPGPYPRDWHLHRDEERYADTVARFAHEYDPQLLQPLPGDVVLFKHGRTFSHGAIVTGDPRAPEPTGWPWVVHAYADAQRVEEIDATGTPLLRLAGRPRPMRAFSYWVR